MAWLSVYYALNEMLCEFDAAMVTDFKNHSALAGKGKQTIPPSNAMLVISQSSARVYQPFP